MLSSYLALCAGDALGEARVRALGEQTADHVRAVGEHHDSCLPADFTLYFTTITVKGRRHERRTNNSAG